jgi:hypothetical protein
LLSKLAALPKRYKPWKALHRRLIVENLSGAWAQPVYGHRQHLAATIDWLCRAQDMRDGTLDAGGVSAGWSFEDGWLPSYPETTGYIIETFLEAADRLQRPDLVSRARRMIEWELSIQLPDGAFPGHFGEPGSRPVIFNTGQIMHGMNVAYEKLGQAEALRAAVRAGHWLARLQDADGAWRKFEYRDIVHTYNTRATWALAKTALLANDARLQEAARRHLDWALAQQQPNGWYANNVFAQGAYPNTHAIAYAIRGLFESGLLLGESRYVDSALKAASAVAGLQREDGWIAGTFDSRWRPTASYCCLTGVAQMCLNWSRMRDALGRGDFQKCIDRGLQYLKTTQRLNDPAPEVRGGIGGSQPFWGAYSRFEYPNWAAKFFADALMLNLDREPS